MSNSATRPSSITRILSQSITGQGGHDFRAKQGLKECGRTGLDTVRDDEQSGAGEGRPQNPCIVRSQFSSPSQRQKREEVNEG